MPDLLISLIVFPFSLIEFMALMLLLLLLMMISLLLYASAVTPQRKKFLAKLKEVSTGKMLTNKRNKATEEDR